MLLPSQFRGTDHFNFVLDAYGIQSRSSIDSACTFISGLLFDPAKKMGVHSPEEVMSELGEPSNHHPGAKK